MNVWKVIKPLQLERCETAETEITDSPKVKVTKALITLSDVLRYNGEIKVEDTVLGSFGIGIISDVPENCSGLKKGTRVYIEPDRECNECYNCKIGNTDQCSDLKIAGEDYDGFLKDFVNVDSNKLFPLPETVEDYEALFIPHLSLAVSVIDKLNIQKGDYVAIVGAGNFGNILAQLLIYYQSVPIILTTDKEDYNIAKESGIYYVFGEEDNWQKEISLITSGRMTKSVIYIADSNIQPAKAFSLAEFSGNVAFTGISYKNNPITLSQAIKKQLNISCVNNNFKNITTAINLVAMKAIDFSHLKLNNSSFENVEQTLSEMNTLFNQDEKIYETVIDLI